MRWDKWEQDGPVIYFIADGLDAIKVGLSTDLYQRFWDIQTYHHRPLTLVGTYPGNKSTERYLHNRWRHLRIRGEWFEYDPCIWYFAVHGIHRRDSRGRARRTSIKKRHQPPASTASIREMRPEW